MTVAYSKIAAQNMLGDLVGELHTHLHWEQQTRSVIDVWDCWGWQALRLLRVARIPYSKELVSLSYSGSLKRMRKRTLDIGAVSEDRVFEGVELEVRTFGN